MEHKHEHSHEHTGHKPQYKDLTPQHLLALTDFFKVLGDDTRLRIVMALSVLCVRTGGAVAGAEATGKSFPDFFERLQNLGVEMEIS